MEGRCGRGTGPASAVGPRVGRVQRPGLWVREAPWGPGRLSGGTCRSGGPARSSRPRPREHVVAVASRSVTAPQDRGSSRRVPLLWPPHGQRDTARARSGALNPAEDGSSLGAPAPHPRPPRTGGRALRPGPGCADGRGPAGPARPPRSPRGAAFSTAGRRPFLLRLPCGFTATLHERFLLLSPTSPSGESTRCGGPSA